jgi:hypothetical protein
MLRGLLPPRSLPLDIQARRIMVRYNNITDPIEKYLFLVQLQDRNETLFYHILARHIKEMAPIIYTPTVGKACQTYAAIFQRARGMYFSAEDKGEMKAMVYNYPVDNVDVVVVTVRVHFKYSHLRMVVEFLVWEIWEQTEWVFQLENYHCTSQQVESTLDAFYHA